MDGSLYRLCEQYDRLLEPSRNSGAKELLTRVSNIQGLSASVRMTARLIGCDCKKVDRIRKIRKDGAPFAMSILLGKLRQVTDPEGHSPALEVQERQVYLSQCRSEASMKGVEEASPN